MGHIGLLYVSNGDLVGHTFCNVGLLAAGGNRCAGTICNFVGVLRHLRRLRGPSNIIITFSLGTPAFHRLGCSTCGTNEGNVPSRLRDRVPLLGR